MPTTDDNAKPDFGFLYDASKTLLGYFVHTWFKHYLNVSLANFARWSQLGLIQDLFTPAANAAQTLPFDFEALNMEKIVFINGIYFYLLACHKAVNSLLMHRFEGKQVLYLRGFDFEGSLSIGGELAMGFASVDEQRFNAALATEICPRFPVFKAFSPKDVFNETIGLDRYFYGDFDALTRVAQRSFLSFYVNALSWKEGVSLFFDRADHFLVYVDSMTESALWELEQLDTAERRPRVTVIFDDEAIKNKDLQIGAQEKLATQFPGGLLWSKQAPTPLQTPAELRAHLAQRFHLTTPGGFKKDINLHCQRIAASNATLPPGQRETWLDFQFHPALSPDKLQEITNFSASLEARIAKNEIRWLPLFLNHIQLRIFLTLLMGNHRETGLAFAAYAAVMQGTLDHYRKLQPDSPHINLLDNHLDMARHIGGHMLSFGRSHEFANIAAQATADFNAVFHRTLPAVENYFAP